MYASVWVRDQSPNWKLEWDLGNIDLEPTATEAVAGAYLDFLCPPEQISARRLVDIGFELANLAESKGTSALIDLMREAQRHAASNMTLAGLIAAGGTSGRTDQASAT